MKALLANRWLQLACRLLLGGIFIYSGWSKIADPPGFAHMIWNYKILPAFFVNAAALVLPWLELAAGAALVAGVWRRGAALALAVLLVAFVGAIGLNLARGNPVDCGCFSTTATGAGPEEMLAEMKIDIVRDLAIIGLAVVVLFERKADQ